MNSLNQPRDVTVSTRKALHLRLDEGRVYVRGGWISAVNQPLSLPFDFGKRLLRCNKGPINNTFFEVNETLSESIMEMYYSTSEITVLATCYYFRLHFYSPLSVGYALIFIKVPNDYRHLHMK